MIAALRSVAFGDILFNAEHEQYKRDAAFLMAKRERMLFAIREAVAGEEA